MKATRVQLFESDRWHMYGLWRIEEADGSTVEIGACIGVPPKHRDSAASAASWRGYTEAWFADSSDWSGMPADVADDALSRLDEAAPVLVEASAESLREGIKVK